MKIQYTKLWDTTKAVLRGIFLATNVYIIKEQAQLSTFCSLPFLLSLPEKSSMLETTERILSLGG